MEPLKRFRMLVVRITLALTAIAGIGGWAFDPTVGKGLLAGGIGGVLAFWLTALTIEKLAVGPKEKARRHAYTWTAVRLLIYTCVLVRAYTWDPDALRGFLGAAAGLLIVRAVTVTLGLTGLDLAEPRSRS